MSHDLYLIAVGLIGARELTDEVLTDVISTLERLPLGLDPVQIEKVKKQLEVNIGVSVYVGRGLHGGDQAPWLDEVKSTQKWNYWDAYSTQLKSAGYSQDVVRVLDDDTHNILNECGNPGREGPWCVKGLVMGDVQSGKTASYCGLINKAADAGYKFIVLLTGMIEELRSQTQERLDEGFVGRDSRQILSGLAGGGKIGAGKYRQTDPNVLTSVDYDFLSANKKALRGIPLENISEPVLLVMKKNKAPLENLITFLDSQIMQKNSALNIPLLLVDDEADNASVNSKKDENPATINKLIREVLSRFNKASYVAYTATPFANVFITPDGTDIFPSNFIYALDTPSNYVGVGQIFTDGGEQEHQLQDIVDIEKYLHHGHKKDHEINDIPASLRTAIYTFLISCAIRDMRREPLRHRSMLVNVTRFTDVQLRIADAIKRELYDLVEEIKQFLSSSHWSNRDRLKGLHEAWLEQYSESEFSWDDVRKGLYEAVASVKVVTINQKSEQSERLNYRAYKNTEKGRRVIAVGGLTLSRGLTLEGLCVSYFYRNSKAYDTLLQMGRWFGYRPGYDDLCRVWMEPDAQGWFEYIASVVAELRADINRMHANLMPPEKFGIRIRAHPDALLITAQNKMRNSETVDIPISYSGRGAETPFLPNTGQANKDNLNATVAFLSKLDPPDFQKPSKLIWKGVDKSVIAKFLESLDISNANMSFMQDMSGGVRPIVKFIAETSAPELQEWDICLPQGDGRSLDTVALLDSNGTSHQIRPRERQFERVKNGSPYLKLNKQRVGEPDDEKVCMKQASIAEAEAAWEQATNRDEKLGKNVPASHYRLFRARPLLTIHLIEPKSPTEGSKSAKKKMTAEEVGFRCLVGVGVSFPRLENEESEVVRYSLNRVALKNFGMVEDVEVDEDED